MAISVVGPGGGIPHAGSALIGGNGGSPAWSAAVPLASLADGDVLVVFGFGHTQAIDVGGSLTIRSGHPAGTMGSTGWSIDGSGWSPLVDEISALNASYGRRSRLFAMWRRCDGTETGFTVTGAGPTQGWSNSNASGCGLRVGSLRMRSDTATPIVLSAAPVVSTVGTDVDDWQPDPTGPVPRDSVGLALASWGLVIPGTAPGWDAWSVGAGNSPRGGDWWDPVDAGDPATPPTLDTFASSGAVPLVAVLAFSDRPTGGGGFTLGLHFGPRRGGFH